MTRCLHHFASSTARKPVALAVLSVVLAGAASSTTAQVLATDGFEDGNRVTTPAGLNWYSIGGFTPDETPRPKAELSVIDATSPNLLITGNHSLRAEGVGSNSEFIAPLPQRIVLGVGDSVVLSFKFRIDLTEVDPIDQPPPSSTGDSTGSPRLSFGLYQDASSDPNDIFDTTPGDPEFNQQTGWGYADGDFDNEVPGAGDDPGIHARIPVGVTDGQARGARIFHEPFNQGNSIFTGSGVVFIAGTDDPATTFAGVAEGDTGVQTVTLTLRRFEDPHYNGDINTYGKVELNDQMFEGSRAGQDLEAQPPVQHNIFDYLVFANSSADFDFILDDVMVQYIPAIPVVPGDTNNDGKVDFADLSTLINFYGQTSVAGGVTVGDFDGDNAVDFEDLSLLINFYGTGTTAAAPVAVPEPTSLSLLALGAVVGLRRRRR